MHVTHARYLQVGPLINPFLPSKISFQHYKKHFRNKQLTVSLGAMTTNDRLWRTIDEMKAMTHTPTAKGIKKSRSKPTIMDDDDGSNQVKLKWEKCFVNRVKTRNDIRGDKDDLK